MSNNEARCRTAAPSHRAAPPRRHTAAPPLLNLSPATQTPPHGTRDPAQAIAAGKARWEGRSDASLIDYLDDQLTSEYKHLQVYLPYISPSPGLRAVALAFCLNPSP